MSLFGALSSGVSGLTAQSSAMGAISDNITNVSTVGYKNTQVDFQTLVTTQTSSTVYSAGGVQSRPRQDTGVQGLLQSSTSQTDLAISGRGFFVVNEANVPTINNEFLYSRAGSFFQDDEGFLRNTAGFYLQGWPTNASGTVVPNNKSLSIPNQNVISTDYLASVNLNRVGGTASATTQLSIGANLPSNDTANTTRKTDVQFFDTLGNANTMSIVYTKTNRDNQWDVNANPPPGTSVLTLEDSSGNAYSSIGQLEFTGRPANDTQVIVNGITYQIDSTGVAADTATVKQVDTSSTTTTAQDVAALVAKIIEADTDFDTTNNRVKVSSGSSTTILFTEDGTGLPGSSPAGISIDPSGLLTSTGARASTQETSFTVRKINSAYRDYQQFTFSALPANGVTAAINGITYTFQTTEAAGDNDTTISTATTVAAMLADLEAAIEANDPDFAVGGTSLRTRINDSQAEPPSTLADTLVLPVLSTSYTVTFSATAGITEPDTTASYTGGTAFTIDKSNAIVFDSDGIPSAFNVAEIEILDFANGAANMDDDPSNSPQITLDFGTVTEANGMTQFGAEFTPVFITQNGSQFGTFAGVTVSTDGLVTALFDNGETRPVFKLPIATFVNVNAMGSRSGNTWNATQGSGDPTLRVADNGPAGQVIQASLESSTVDIGTEFTKMIVVQRAFSAASKIISTADQMLEELLRTKR